MSEYLTDDERLAVLKAIDKGMKPVREELESAARTELIDRFREDGTDRRAIIAGGVKVGEVGLSYSKPKPYIMMGHETDAISFLEELGLTETVPVKGWESHFSRAGDAVVCSDTGEIVDWAAWQPKEVRTAAVRGCNPQEVMDAMAGRLQGANVEQLLLGGM